MPQSASLPDLQLNLILSFAANFGQTQQNITPQQLQAGIQAGLAQSPLTAGKYQMIWGPAISMDPDGFPANVTFILQGTQDTSDYRVVTSGTNFLALLELALEDLDVIPPLVPFQNYVKNSPASALISPATNTGLQVILNTPPSLKTGTGTLLQAIGTLPPNAKLTVAGHSLGGTLASTLALYLHETFSTLAANLRCFAYAGATAGNAAFARYSDQVLQDKLTRIWNTMDVVPHAWDSAQLAQLKNLYSGIDTPWYVTDVAQAIIDLDLGYTHVSPAYKLEGHQNSDPENGTFKAQAGYQHIPAYLALLKLA
jgi:triacylglycerol lipase